MINPMMIFSAMQSGQNPMQFAQQMVMQDPRAAQAVKIMQGKNAQQLEQIARNMAREKGIDLDAAMRQLMGR